MKLTTIFVSRTKQNYAKTLTISESTFKMKVMSPWTLFEVLVSSAVIGKQRLLDENEVMQNPQSCIYQNVKAISESPCKLL